MTIHKTAVVGGIAAAGIIAAFSATGTASASCASLNGNHIGKGCEGVNGGLALGLGPKATAVADGPGTVAISIGGRGVNNVPAYGDQPTQTLARGAGNFSLAVGNGTNAGSLGKGNVAIALGNGSNASSFGGHPVEKNKPSRFNTSVVLGNRGNAYAIGPRGKHAFQVGQGTDLQQDN